MFTISKCKKWEEVSEMVLRPIDYKECTISGQGKLTAKEVYQYSVQTSERVYKVLDDGELVAVFGIADAHHDKVGVPWLLASDTFKFTKNALNYAKNIFIPYTCSKYDVLFNYVHKDNDSSIRFLKWLGFGVYQPDSDGMCKFQMIKGGYNV